MEQGRPTIPDAGKNATNRRSVLPRESYSSAMHAIVDLFQGSAHDVIDTFDSQIEGSWKGLEQEECRHEVTRGQLWDKEREANNLLMRVDAQNTELAEFRTAKEASYVTIAARQIEVTKLEEQLRGRQAEHDEEVRSFEEDLKTRNNEVDSLRHELTAYQDQLYTQCLEMGDVHSKVAEQESALVNLEAELTTKFKDLDLRTQQLGAATADLMAFKANNTAAKLEASERKNNEYAQMIVDLHKKVARKTSTQEHRGAYAHEKGKIMIFEEQEVSIANIAHANHALTMIRSTLNTILAKNAAADKSQHQLALGLEALCTLPWTSAKKIEEAKKKLMSKSQCLKDLIHDQKGPITQTLASVNELIIGLRDMPINEREAKSSSCSKKYNKDPNSQEVECDKVTDPRKRKRRECQPSILSATFPIKRVRVNISKVDRNSEDSPIESEYQQLGACLSMIQDRQAEDGLGTR